jgi:proteic killer suppression protein
MIKSFADKETRKLWERGRSRRVPTDLQRRALRRLAMLNAAASLEVLRAVLGNRLERLFGDRAGQHSVRINEQYRVCFVWESGDAYEVEVTDYH